MRRKVVAACFDGIDDEVEGLQYLEKITSVRLILFIITLTQSIKLFALGGVPWSQASGYLLVASFIHGDCEQYLRHFDSSRLLRAWRTQQQDQQVEVLRRMQ
jgi:hypothetical protein